MWRRRSQRIRPFWQPRVLLEIILFHAESEGQGIAIGELWKYVTRLEAPSRVLLPSLPNLKPTKFKCKRKPRIQSWDWRKY